MKTFVAKSLLALGLSAAVLTVPATAQTPIDTIGGQERAQIEFRYRGWDTPAENYQVVRRLARRACKTEGPRPLAFALVEQACVAELVDGAIAQIGRPQIAQIHFNATGRRVSSSSLVASNQR